MPQSKAEQKPHTDYPSPSTESVHGLSEHEEHSPDTSFETCDETNEIRKPGQETTSREDSDFNRVLKIIHTYTHGLPLPLHDDESPDWLQFQLTPSQYNRLSDETSGHFPDLVRHDYDHEAVA
jgi:hypothetical protein